jgi:site-specific DNA-methyltransferase (adenine-specific)
MKIVSVPVEKVKPYWRNPRRNDAAVDAVKASIKRYGFNSPIVVDADFVVVAGHTRLRAARQLEMTEVPVVVVDLPPQKAKAYRIADNAAGSIASWNHESLVKELEEMANVGVMQVFFKEGELAGLMTAESFDDAMDDVTVEDEQDEPAGPLQVCLDCPHCSHSFKVEANSL